MAPEILDELLCSTYHTKMISLGKCVHEKDSCHGENADLAKLGEAIDTWSLGLILFEIVLGFPLSLGEECLIKHHGSKKPFLVEGGFFTGCLQPTDK